MKTKIKQGSSSRVVSFFTSYFGTRHILLEDKTSDRYSLYRGLIAVIDTYLDSLAWVKDEVDTNIYLLTKQGLVGKQIAVDLNIPLPTYRTRVSRITKLLNQTLFKGKTAYDIPNLSDTEITDLTSKISCLNSVVNLGENTLVDIYSFINKDINTVKIAEKPDDIEVFAALVFLASFSKQHMKSLYKRVDLSVLKYVVEELNKKEGSLTAKYYFGVVDAISNFSIKEPVINRIKEKIDV